MTADTTTRFFSEHPELRRRLADSAAFRRIKDEARVEIDGEELYISKGDALGSAEELFVEAVIRGAAGQGEANRDLAAELDPAERELVLRTFLK